MFLYCLFKHLFLKKLHARFENVYTKLIFDGFGWYLRPHFGHKAHNVYRYLLVVDFKCLAFGVRGEAHSRKACLALQYMKHYQSYLNSNRFIFDKLFTDKLK